MVLYTHFRKGVIFIFAIVQIFNLNTFFTPLIAIKYNILMLFVIVIIRLLVSVVGISNLRVANYTVSYKGSGPYDT